MFLPAGTRYDEVRSDTNSLPLARAFGVLRSGEVVDSGYGTLTFEKPSAVRFKDNTADTEYGVSRGFVRCTTGLSCRAFFAMLQRHTCCRSGILNARLSAIAQFNARL